MLLYAYFESVMLFALYWPAFSFCKSRYMKFVWRHRDYYISYTSYTSCCLFCILCHEMSWHMYMHQAMSCKSVDCFFFFYAMVFHFLSFILGRGGMFLIWRWLIYFLNGTKFNIYCRLGAHRRRGDVGTEQDFQITRMISHESYRKPYGIAHDIALLKLHKPAMINRNVGLACLPPSSGSVADGKHCWVSGNNTKE